MASDHPDETRLLLHDQGTAKPAPTPIPKAQLATLCTLRIVEPIASTQLFPYVNEFISDLHLTDDPSRIGFYSGLVVRCIPTSAPLTSPSPPSGKRIFCRPTYFHIPLGSSIWSAYLFPSRSSCAHSTLRRHRTSSHHPRGYLWHRGHYSDVRIVKITHNNPHHPVHRSGPDLAFILPSLILSQGDCSLGTSPSSTQCWAK